MVTQAKFRIVVVTHIVAIMINLPVTVFAAGNLDIGKANTKQPVPFAMASWGKAMDH